MELLDLANFASFLSQMTLLRLLTFLLDSLFMSLRVLLFWVYFFFLMLVFVLQWLCLYWEILIMLCQFPLTFYQTHSRMPHFIAELMTIFMLIRMVFLIIWEMFYGRISINSVLLLLLVNLMSGFSVELMYRSLIASISLCIIYLHGFQLLVLLT